MVGLWELTSSDCTERGDKRAVHLNDLDTRSGVHFNMDMDTII